MSNRVFVIDTNVLIDYVDIIPALNSPDRGLSESTIDFTGSCVVIPTMVARELIGFKDDIGDTHRKRAASELLRRLCAIFDWDPPTMDEIYNASSTAQREIDGVTFMSLPVHKNFHHSLPLMADKKRGDDNILLAVLAMAFIRNGLPIDGTVSVKEAMKLKIRDVFLVTNDREFSYFAWTNGVRALEYHYKQPEPYTGIREVVVPKDLLYQFLAARKLTLGEWHHNMPNEPRLISNEFIVMSLKNEQDYPRNYRDTEYSNVGRYDPRTKAIVPLDHMRHFPIRPKSFHQAAYLEALLHPNIDAVICTGPAGAGKTFLAIAAGIALVSSRMVKRIYIVPCKEQETFGWLPGDMDNKISPYIDAFKDALRSLIEYNEFDLLKNTYIAAKSSGKNHKKNGKGHEEADKDGLSEGDIDNVADLAWKNYCRVMPVKFAAGRNLTSCLLFCDEFQLQNTSNARLLINRLGQGSKLVLAGDLAQTDQQYATVWDNGITYAMDVTYDLDDVARVSLVEDDIGRNKLVRAIAKRLEERKRSKSRLRTKSNLKNDC